MAMPTASITFKLADEEKFIDAYRKAAQKGGVSVEDQSSKVASHIDGDAEATAFMIAEIAAEDGFEWEAAGLTF